MFVASSTYHSFAISKQIFARFFNFLLTSLPLDLYLCGSPAVSSILFDGSFCLTLGCLF